MVERLRIPEGVAEMSRKLFEGKRPPKIPEVYNLISVSFQALQDHVGGYEFTEAQLRDARGEVVLGYYKRPEGLAVGTVQPELTRDSEYLLMPRGGRIRVFRPKYKGDDIVYGKPQPFPVHLRRRILEVIADGEIQQLSR